MDKEALVTELRKVTESFANESRRFEFVNLEPVFPGDSYVLNVCADWLDEVGCNEAIALITGRMFSLLNSDVIRKVNRVDILDRKGELHCWAAEEDFARGSIRVA